MRYDLFVSKQKTEDTILQFTEETLQQHQSETRVEKAFLFTDGPSGQYKNRHTETDTVLSESLHGVPTERHFHATSHAKGRQDGFGSVFKGILRNTVARDGEEGLVTVSEFM